MNWKHALLSALDSIGMFDVLTPTEVDAMASHMAASASLRYEDEIAPHPSGIKTLRDEFAGRAMIALHASEQRGGRWTSESDAICAKNAYRLADAMLTARDETVEKIEEAG